MTYDLILSSKYTIKKRSKWIKSIYKIIYYRYFMLSNFSPILYVYLMKKLLIITFILSSILLYGCNKDEWFKYEFENFYSTFETSQSFEDEWTELNWLWYNLLKSSIVKIYYQSTHEDFRESIIISKKNSDKSIESFAKDNIDNIDIDWLRISRWKSFEIKCNWITYNFVYYQWRYSLNQYNIYISEWFLKSWENIYIISYATLDEKNRNNFSSSFKNIQCK